MKENKEIPYGYIYKIRNKLNNRIYVGQTIENNPFDRIKDHFSKSTLSDPKNKNHKFYNAVRKYGEENFTIDIICECYSENDLNQTEIYFIVDYYKSHLNSGYNIRLGGSRGQHSESTKKKMSQKGLERYNISNKITPKIKKFILLNIDKGRKWITQEIENKFNIKCSNGLIIDFIQENRQDNEAFKVSRDKNGRKILSEAQRKEISQTLKNRNEQNRIKRLGMNKEQLFELGNKCNSPKELHSHFTCSPSFVGNCLLQWFGSYNFYKVFNKQRISWNKK